MQALRIRVELLMADHNTFIPYLDVPLRTNTKDTYKSRDEAKRSV